MKSGKGVRHFTEYRLGCVKGRERRSWDLGRRLARFSRWWNGLVVGCCRRQDECRIGSAESSFLTALFSSCNIQTQFWYAPKVCINASNNSVRIIHKTSFSSKTSVFHLRIYFRFYSQKYQKELKYFTF